MLSIPSFTKLIPRQIFLFFYLPVMMIPFFSGCDVETILSRRLYERNQKNNNAHLFEICLGNVDAVVIDHFETKSGGTIFYLENTESRWAVEQTIKLDEYLTVFGPFEVAYNDYWMVLSGATEKTHGPNKLIIFKNSGTKWEYVDTSHLFSELNNVEHSIHITLSKKNQLFISTPANDNDRKIFCYELSESNFPLKEDVLSTSQSVFRSSKGDTIKGDQYSLRFKKDGNIEVFKTEELDNGRVLWTVPFDTEIGPHISSNVSSNGIHKKYSTDFLTNGNTIVGSYVLRTFDHNSGNAVSSGRIKFYTITPETGIEEVFSMTASRGGNLHVEEVQVQ